MSPAATGGADQIAGGEGTDTAFYGGGLRSYAVTATGAPRLATLALIGFGLAAVGDAVPVG